MCFFVLYYFVLSFECFSESGVLFLVVFVWFLERLIDFVDFFKDLGMFFCCFEVFRTFVNYFSFFCCFVWFLNQVYHRLFRACRM